MIIEAAASQRSKRVPSIKPCENQVLASKRTSQKVPPPPKLHGPHRDQQLRNVPCLRILALSRSHCRCRERQQQRASGRCCEALAPTKTALQRARLRLTTATSPSVAQMESSTASHDSARRARVSKRARRRTSPMIKSRRLQVCCPTPAPAAMKSTPQTWKAAGSNMISNPRSLSRHTEAIREVRGCNRASVRLARWQLDIALANDLSTRDLVSHEADISHLHVTTCVHSIEQPHRCAVLSWQS